jgi:type IV pilus assembly protein PilV
MSAGLKHQAPCGTALAAAPVSVFRCASTGVGMLEFLVALLIFSLGMMGLVSAQLVGKRTGFEAAQRSVATGLARDMLERMRANPGQVETYRHASIGDANQRLPMPATLCDTSDCSAAQLAEFDLWQWESLLLGDNETGAGGNRGGLVEPRACITTDGGRVFVAISWRGATTAAEAPQAACVEPGAVPDDEAEDGNGVTAQRRRLVISTFIAEA